MKRIFAKCFLQKQNQNTKGNKNEQPITRVNSHKQDTENKYLSGHNANGDATNSLKPIRNKENAEPKLNGKDVPNIKENNGNITSEKSDIGLNPNQQRRKILDSQKTLLRSFKPDILPHGSPARKRVRSSRSNSKTLSFICLDSAEHSDDDCIGPLEQKGIIWLKLPYH